ncbi:hypothetical protein [Luedemannella helvata]|uniref:DUF3592 domain-containing protein n=1 Tax=Luedemannella helvata TaxID=349315 RepID=A0ABN2KH48_9ACTN
MRPQPTPAPAVPMAGARSAGTSVGWTLLVVLLGFLFAGLNTVLAYVTLGLPNAIPIGVGLVLCLAFAVAVRLLHRAAWLSWLSILPALFVLVGSVQLAPEAALDRRGVRQDVVIVDAKAVGKRHSYTLSGPQGQLTEPLIYAGSNPGYQVGDRLTVVTDPEGVVELEDAAKVDPAGMVGALLFGLSGWTVTALLAGWRGHARRQRGRHDDLVI